MYSYNEVELRTRNVTACDQERITFSGESKKKKIVLKVVLLVYICLVMEKLLSHLNQMTIVKKKVSSRI